MYENVKFLPMSRREMEALGWDSIDILLLTGDAYVEHPSFGTAVIGRYLLDKGFRVGVVAQPDWKDPESLKVMGRPNIAVGVSSGNMDSMVCIYTVGRRFRKDDMYSPGGKTGNRPPMAAVVYTQLAKRAFPGIKTVLGGVEASLRRVAHYDYWQDKMHPSELVESKADILIFGMGETASLEVYSRIRDGKPLDGIPGTARFLGGNASKEFDASGCVELPSYERICSDKDALLEQTRRVEAEMNPWCGRRMIQRYNDRLLVLERPNPPLSQAELDHVCELPYGMAPHPSYKEPIPAYECVKFSVPAVRGCPGGCAFCGLVSHQTRHLVSRSPESVMRSIERIKKLPGFNGIISDIGGAASNIFGNRVADHSMCEKCRRISCMWPKPCKNYIPDGSTLLKLLKTAMKSPGIRKVFLNSGMRLDLALRQPELTLEIIRNHVSGHLKVAPEHLHPRVLNLMRKGQPGELEAFMKMFDKCNKQIGKEQYLIPLFISNFPGCTEEEMKVVDDFLEAHHWSPQQVQDYIPLPMTMGAAMYYSGKNPYTGEEIEVHRGLRDRRTQIQMLKKTRASRYRQPDWKDKRDRRK